MKNLRKMVVSFLKEDKEIKKIFLGALEQLSDNEFFTEAFNLFINLELQHDEAMKHWEKVLKLDKELDKKLGKKLKIPTLIMYYFLEDKKIFEKPYILNFEKYKDLENTAIYDYLTPAYNRKFFSKILSIELKRAKRYNHYLSGIMLDIDDYKKVNDEGGHKEGDRVLIEFVEFLLDKIRSTDYLFRYGGDEFFLLLPHTEINGAFFMMHRILREYIDKYKRSFSAGISSVNIDATTENELVEHADMAMYRAKFKGKGQIELFLKERRQFFRYSFTFELLYKPPNSGDYLLTEGKNISQQGFLFLSNFPIGIDEKVEFSLRLPNTDIRVCGKSKVKRIEKISNNVFEIGVSILELDKDSKDNFKNFFSVDNI